MAGSVDIFVGKQGTWEFIILAFPYDALRPPGAFYRETKTLENGR